MEIPIRSGVDVADWWDWGTEPAEAPVAWTGKNKASSESRVRLRLFMKSWKNPRPAAAIKSLDLIAGKPNVPPGQSAPAPFLVAVTGALGPGRERWGGEQEGHPTYVIIDREGKIRYIEASFNEGEIEATLQALMGK